MTSLVEYAVVKANRENGPGEIGTPWHTRCLYQYNRAYVDRHFSIGEIDPANLDGKRCGFCGDDWRTGPKRLDPYPGRPSSSCLNCPPKPERFPMDGVIAVGFGGAYVERDGEIVLDGEAATHDPKAREITGADAERVAALDPDHDWRIVLDGPLGGQVYQRHGEGEWVYVIRLPGFA